MTKKRNGKLRTKLILMTILPVIIISLLLNGISAINLKNKMFEKAEDGIMERSPRPITQRLMNRHDLFQMGYVSALMAIFALIGYEWFIRGGASEINATTMMVFRDR